MCPDRTNRWLTGRFSRRRLPAVAKPSLATPRLSAWSVMLLRPA